MQLVAHKLEVLQQFLSTLTILPLFFVSQEVVRYHLRMQASAYKNVPSNSVLHSPRIVV